jgi:hypothetical protein
MLNLIWNTLKSATGRSNHSASKRSLRNARRWETASEFLESRQLLSATNSAAPVAAETTMAKEQVVFPNVAGSWDVTTEGVPGTQVATISQNKNKVSYSVAIPGIGSFDVKDHFTKHNSHTLSGTEHLSVETAGKVKVQFTLTFADGANPTTFVLQTTTSGKNIPEPIHTTINGTKQTPPVTASAHAAPTLPDISGHWDLTATAGGVALPADLTFTQSGKHVVGTTTITGIDITVTGNLKHNSTDLKGKATADAGGGAKLVKGKFDVNFASEFTTFQGNATFKIPNQDTGKKETQVFGLDGEKSLG